MIREILDRFTGKKIMVLGDLMLDHYIWGSVERISPEAPVPILEACAEEFKLGGAANVALNVRSLGAEVIPVGVLGSDDAGSKIKELFIQAGIPSDALISEPGRPTTQKTRIGSVNQQIVRIDREVIREISSTTQAEVLQTINKFLPQCDALIIEDYDKGMLAEGLIESVLELARATGIPVAVDPKHKNFFAYHRIDLFKPNYRELRAVVTSALDDEELFFSVAEDLRKEMQIKYMIVTRGAQGMYVFAGDPKPLQLPTVAKDVFDVSGAGDTVICALTLAYISGAEISLAAEIANHAAGVVCGVKGTATVNKEQILASYHEQG